MKTVLPRSIMDITGAKEFLRALFLNGESYHPEDGAQNIVSVSSGHPVFSPAEAKTLNRLMAEVYDLKQIDPCEYLLELEFRKEHFIDQFEELSGFTVWPSLELDEEDKPGAYGDPDRYVSISNNEGKILVLGFTSGRFYLIYDGVINVDADRLAKLYKDIKESFKSL